MMTRNERRKAIKGAAKSIHSRLKNSCIAVDVFAVESFEDAEACLKGLGKALKAKGTGLSAAMDPSTGMTLIGVVATNEAITQERLTNAALIACMGAVGEVDEQTMTSNLDQELFGNSQLDLEKYRISEEEFNDLQEQDDFVECSCCGDTIAANDAVYVDEEGNEVALH